MFYSKGDVLGFLFVQSHSRAAIEVHGAFTLLPYGYLVSFSILGYHFFFVMNVCDVSVCNAFNMSAMNEGALLAQNALVVLKSI